MDIVLEINKKINFILNKVNARKKQKNKKSMQ
jgi:hypothetical protein